MTRTIYKIDTHSHLTTIDLDAGGDDLKTLQDIVGGYIQHVHLGDSLSMYVNEDGIAKKLSVNTLASHIHATRHPGRDGRILGDVALTGGVDGDGDILGLDEITSADILALITTQP